YISERQARQVRGLIQSRGIQPKLAIINSNQKNLASQKYTQLKQIRAKELGVKAELYEIEQKDAPKLIQKLSQDRSVHGIILQLPLENPNQTDELINLIPPEKDVDALGKSPIVEPATVEAILWLLAGYNIELKNKNILIVGRGRLVGKPLESLLKGQGLEPTSLDVSSTKKELTEALIAADIVISATGSPGLIKPEMLKSGQVVIDAGTSEDTSNNGKLLGDVDPTVYESSLDLKITPVTGGLGPLTISCLFENLLKLIDKSIL
ncbi:MAG: methylenetetrahydrofolate dehydrogenase / methenyltetrahydrofolate cyclohydrolase, partial [Patescibacteria group bacterium]|nr:methylenetetrahydrofolate dehydrogenase / methenyltetrahydrofolate cyclohydrolase [Patescibacteria group bacterium]